MSSERSRLSAPGTRLGKEGEELSSEAGQLPGLNVNLAGPLITTNEALAGEGRLDCPFEKPANPLRPCGRLRSGTQRNPRKRQFVPYRRCTLLPGPASWSGSRRMTRAEAGRCPRRSAGRDPRRRASRARKRRESPLSPSGPEPTSGLGNNPTQLAEANWLGQVLIDADFPGAPPIFLAGIARDDDDPRSGERFVFSHSPSDLVAVHPGQP